MSFPFTGDSFLYILILWGKNMTISFRVSETDGILLKKYAESYHESVSSFLRRLAMQQIEHDYLELCERMEKYTHDISMHE